MKNHKIICKISAVFLAAFLSFCSINVYAQLTYVSCASTCSSTLVGHVTFANTSGTTTGRWNVNSLAYGGLTNESFTITDPVSFTYAAAGNLTSTGGGTYTIVSNPSSVNGPTGTALASSSSTTATGGTFLFRPNNNTNNFAVYTISGLQVGGKYCVRVKMRNAAAHLDCNQSLYTTIQFNSLTGLGISGGGVTGGMWNRVSSSPACTGNPNSGSWDGNNQSYGLLYDQDESWYETNFQLGQNPNNTNDNGFQIAFKANAWDADDVWGIEEIEVYGCITQQITSSNGTSVCQATPTTLTAQGIGSTTDTYVWKQSTNGGTTYTVVPSSTSYTLSTTPGVATMYSATCVRTGLTVNTTITPVNCCGPTGLFTIPKVCDAITIDGVDNEPVWYTAPWQTVNVNNPLVGTQDCINANASCAGQQSNPAGKWRCVYTPTDIYFDVQVNDANPQNTANVYYQDAVEIYIANSSNTPLQFGYTYKNGVPGFYNSNGAVNGSAKIVKNATYWDLEVDIPIAANNINIGPGYINMELGINQANIAGGCSICRAAQLFTWTAANHYTSTAQYHSAPLSDCASVKASADTICNGGSSTLTTQLSTVNAGLPYSWQQSTDGGVTWTAVAGAGTTNTITVTPIVQTQYRATYDAVISCPVTISIGAITFAVTNPAAVCAPSTVDLTAAAVTAGSQAGLTYTYFTNALATIALSNPNAVSASNTYYIQGTSSSCYGVKPVIVVVNPQPTATISGTTAVCQNVAAPNITFTGANGTAPYTFTYNINGGGNLTATTVAGNSVTVAVPTTTAGGFAYNLTGVKDASSTTCSNVVTGQTATVTVNATPTITGTLTVCIGNTTTLTGSATAAAVTPWVSATPAVATVSNTGVVTGVTAGSSVITYTNTNGCTITATVTVNALPTITGTLNVCIGNTTTLTGSATAAAVTPWVSATPAVATVSNTGVVTGVTVGSSVITYTNSNGCTKTATVTVNALPTITGTLSVCIGNTTTLTGSATAAAVTPWVSATPAVATVSNTGVVTGVTAGSSVITYTNSNGCTITATVTVNALPTVTGTLSVCIGNTTTLTGSATAAAVNPWVSATPAVATVSNTGVVTGVTAGSSVITYTNSNGCTKTVTVTVNALPTITGTLNVCIGNTTTLTGSATAAAVTPWVSATPAVATISNTGVVTGVAAGGSVITYTNTNGCVITATVNVNTLPTITGSASVAVAATTNWTGSATAAAVTPWVSATPAVATVSNTGVVIGVANGTSVITYTNSNGCTITKTITVNNLPTISGPDSTCLGTPITLIGSGTPAAVNPWVSGTPAVATISNTGVITTVSAGTTLITYKDNNGNTATQTETVNALPTITGTLNVCIANTTTLTGSPTPAAVTPWVSATPAVATISNTGVVTGVTAGSSVITYTNTLGCVITATANVNALPTITGTLSVCIGNTTTLTGSATAAAVNPWVSATPAVATVSNTGVVTGVTAGSSVITYTNSNGCTKTATVTVNALPTITGTLNVCIGNTTTLTGSATAAAVTPWVSATPAVATISNTGVVTGVTAGSSVITYTNTNGCVITATVNVNTLPTITGSASVAIAATTTWTGSATAAAVTPWVSATPAVATVSNTGVVTGVTAGTSVITYTNSNGCTITKTITVNNLPTISGPDSTCLGTPITLTGSGVPAVLNPWVSGTPAVATISNTGVLTTVSAGTTLITYTDINGNTATKTETVNALPTITGTLNVCIANTTTLTGSATAAAVNPWVSATPAVATVGNTGVVTGVTAGSSVITYTNGFGCVITATANVNALPTITGTLNVCIGNTTTLTGSATAAAVNPWVSATPAVATVSNTGVVTGVTNGSSVITYTNSNGCTITATVTVNALPTIGGVLNVCIANTTTLTGSGAPAAVNPWVSATPAVATISNTGVVTGVAAGSSIITYTNSNGCTITATVNVDAPPTITGAASVAIASTANWTGSATAAAVNPWVSASPGVATVSNTGVVTGVANGTSVITYTNSNGCTTTKTITVNNLPSISGPDSTCLGTPITLIGSGTPALVNPWVSGTPAVATISNTGVITTVSAGTTLITYTDINGNTATQTETVNALPTITGILNVCVANTITLTGSPTPAAVTPWVSATPAVATVGNTGIVTGVSNGTSVITYTNTFGCVITATANVNALPTITGTLNVCIGNTTTLTGSATAAAVNPWVSATPAVATVSNTGVVTGVTAGSSVITYTNSNGCTTTATVTVNALPTITGTLNVCIGNTTTLTGSATAAAVNPWVSATPAVATVSNTGVVTGVTAGSSVITYTNSNGCTITATVNVNALPTITGTLSVCIANTTTLTGSATAAAVNPWVSATPAVATVSNTGVVTGVTAGSSVITYTNTNGCTITATVTVNALPTITGTLSVCIANTTTLTGSATAAAVNPWVSATPAVATVDNAGVVTGVTAGSSVITYTNSNGCTTTATVTVNALPTITGTLSVCVGNTTSLTGSATAAAVNPWVSATPAVATVSNTGVVTGVSAGSSVITYTNTNGCTITATVNVNALPTITGTLSVCVGNTTPLTGSPIAAAVNPWLSATASVATVDNTGNVTGVSAGTSVITYTNSNGCISNVTVTVDPVPVLQITNPAPVCTPGTVDLTAAAVTAGSTLPAGTFLTYYTDAAATMAVPNQSAVATSGTYYIKAQTGSGCTDVQQVIVTVNQTPAAPAKIGDTSACADFPTLQTLTAVGRVTTPAGIDAVWYDAAMGGNQVNPTLNAVNAITYYAEADPNPPTGCISATRTPVTLAIVNPPTVKVADTAINIDLGYFTQLIGTVIAAPGDSASYSWTEIPNIGYTDMSSPDSLYPYVNPIASTYYTLTGRSTTYVGCMASATVHVTVLKPILIPNAFSPNGDHNHDTWYIENLEQYPSAEVDVFNRYGQFVFRVQGNYLERPWDGTYKGQPVPIGEYYYIIKLNSGTDHDAKPIAGGVSVIR